MGSDAPDPPHSMDLLEPPVKAGKLQVWFTHMNHSNPALGSVSIYTAAS